MNLFSIYGYFNTLLYRDYFLKRKSWGIYEIFSQEKIYLNIIDVDDFRTTRSIIDEKEDDFRTAWSITMRRLRKNKVFELSDIRDNI